MRTITIGAHTVVMYDAIEELPIKRFHKYNKMLLVDAGIGSTLADFDAHIQKAMVYAKSKTPEMAVTELENLRQNVYMIQSALSPRNLAFATLVKKIDGEECEDLTDEGLQKIVDLFADAPVNEMTAPMEAVKKKIDDELQLYFPHLFDDASVKEYYDQMRRRTLVILDNIINGESEKNREVIERLTMELYTYNKPHVFAGSDNLEIQHDKNFERMCVTISQYLHVDPKNYTVLEFYNAFEYVRDLLKAKQKRQTAK